MTTASPWMILTSSLDDLLHTSDLTLNAEREERQKRARQEQLEEYDFISRRNVSCL